MRKRKIFLLLAGTLALTLAACAPAGEAHGPTLSLSAPLPEASEPALSTPVPEPTAPPTAHCDLPDRDYRPWQTVYMEFLTLLQTRKTTWEPGWRGEEVGSETYSLYDVDKDGVPELFVKFGTCEAGLFCPVLYHVYGYARQGCGRDGCAVLLWPQRPVYLSGQERLPALRGAHGLS